MTLQEVLHTPGFDWPVLHARVVWSAPKPDAQGVFAVRLRVGHAIAPDDPDVGLVYEIKAPAPTRTLLVLFEAGRVKWVRCVRLTR
jgi:hypothetical protein